MANNKKNTASKVARELDISVVTLTNWYKWYKNDKFVKPENTPVLPEYEQSNPRAARYWSDEDIEQLKAFKAWVPKGRGGIMGCFNSKFWGERSKKKSDALEKTK